MDRNDIKDKLPEKGERCDIKVSFMPGHEKTIKGIKYTGHDFVSPLHWYRSSVIAWKESQEPLPKYFIG